MTEAIAGMGTIVTINSTPVEGVQDVTGLQLTTDTDEITNNTSPDGVEEFIATIKRLGEVTFPMVVEPGAVGQQALYAAWVARSKDPYIITWPDGTTQSFDGFCTGYSLSSPYAGHVSADVTIRPAAAPSINFGGS